MKLELNLNIWKRVQTNIKGSFRCRIVNTILNANTEAFHETILLPLTEQASFKQKRLKVSNSSFSKGRFRKAMMSKISENICLKQQNI